MRSESEAIFARVLPKTLRRFRILHRICAPNLFVEMLPYPSPPPKAAEFDVETAVSGLCHNRACSKAMCYWGNASCTGSYVKVGNSPIYQTRKYILVLDAEQIV